MSIKIMSMEQAQSSNGNNGNNDNDHDKLKIEMDHKKQKFLDGLAVTSAEVELVKNIAQRGRL